MQFYIELWKNSQQLVNMIRFKTQQLGEPRDSGLDRLRPDRGSFHKLNKQKQLKLLQ